MSQFLFGCVLLSALAAHADDHPGEVTAAFDVFSEPAAAQQITVLTPSVNGKIDAAKWLSIKVDWLADVVSGATPSTYGRVDAVSAATQFSELRNNVGADLEWRPPGPFSFHTAYHFGIENDYRSHALSLGAKLDLFHHNTQLWVDYAHNFDLVCDLNNIGLEATQRQPLGQSAGCFTSARGLVEEYIAIDAVEVGVSQVFTQRLIGSLLGYFEHDDGFLSNPYRRVRLYNGSVLAQESHPHLRDRGAVGGRLRYVPGESRGVLGFDGRFYRDTWAITAFNAEASWDHLVANDHFRYKLRARYYHQSRASFYRDAGETNSYEQQGPAGQYFTGDREMSSFGDLLLGVIATYRLRPSNTPRLGGAFTKFDFTARLDLVKVFAFTHSPPNLPRVSGVVDAIIAGVSILAGF